MAWIEWYSLSLQTRAEFFLATVPPEFVLACLETPRRLTFSTETNIVSLPPDNSLDLGHSSEMLFKY